MSNELSDALHELRELRERLKESEHLNELLEHRYKDSEVWLACFTAILSSTSQHSSDELAEATDKAAKEYWERFK